MNYGMYVSASGALTSMARQDVLANNLANVRTAAFKPDSVGVRARDPASVEDGLPWLPSNKLLEKLGAGSLLAAVRTDFSPGPVETTKNKLDIALEGPGFFAVDTGVGEGEASQRLTRDGRLTLDQGGRLVRISDGRPIMDAGNRPIVFDPAGGEIEIQADGAVWQGQDELTRLKIVSPPDPSVLKKDGEGLYAFPGERAPTGGPRGRVLQGAVEQSSVDPFMTLMAITKAGSLTEANTRLMTLHDQTMGRAVQTLGRVN